MDIKPGYKTTEFWMTIANAVFMVLVAVGVLTQEDAQELETLVAGLIAAIVPLMAYIFSRAIVKTVQKS